MDALCVKIIENRKRFFFNHEFFGNKLTGREANHSPLVNILAS